MKTLFALLLCVVASLAHAQTLSGHEDFARSEMIAQTHVMSCCDTATGGHGAVTCATCVVPMLTQIAVTLRPITRQVFVIGDWQATERRAPPPKGPPRLG